MRSVSFAMGTVCMQALLAAALLAGCGGGGGGGGPDVSPPPGNVPPPPPSDPFAADIAAAIAGIQADTCFRAADTRGCDWTEHVYRPAEFSMANSTGEAVLVIDTLPSLPVRAFRFRNRIKGYYRAVPGGIAAAGSTWRLPTALWKALDRLTRPSQIPAHRLREVFNAAAASYDGVQLDTAGHGSYVLSLLVDANPNQPLVLMGGLNLYEMNRADYCDTSGAAVVQARLLQTAEQAAAQLTALIRAENVRFINYSAGHSLPVVAEAWPAACGTATPPENILRAKLAAFAPLYKVLFATPGVVTAQASAESSSAADYPYDQAAPEYPNRLRVGYFTSLASNLDAAGAGKHAGLNAWPSAGKADIWLNTGVLPQRPYEYNRTPLLQVDQYGLSAFPITAPQPSWVAPLALSRLINLRHAGFGTRAMDEGLVADLLDHVVPASCPDLPQQRCRYQDPLLHGQIEAVRLGLRPLTYMP